MALPTLEKLDTLPALPLCPDSSGLDVRGMLIISLCWLRGGRITDYLSLDLSPHVLGAMLLQAASDHGRISRYMRECNAYREGLRDGMNRAFSVANGET